MKGPARGGYSLILDTGFAAAKISGQPTLDAGVEVGGGDFGEEAGGVDGVEGFRIVYSDKAGPPGRLLVVESVSNTLGDGEEGRGAASVGSEAVLGRVSWEVRVERGEQETFQDFGGW